MALLAVQADDAAAEQNAPVQLRSTDGSISIGGNLLSFNDNIYEVATPVGTLRVDARSVECIGVLCPVVKKVEPRFGIHGSSTVGTELIPNLLRGYASHVGATYNLVVGDKPKERLVQLTKPDGSLLVEVDLQTYGSGTAFPALAAGTADIGIADRRMKDGDLPKLAEGGIGELRDTENEIVLGLDGLVVITHPDNPVRNLTMEELGRIYAGQVENWLELGGGDHPITVHSFGKSSGTRSTFLDRVVTPFGLQETPQAVENASYSGMVESVLADRGAIGFTGRASAGKGRILDVREPCGLLSPPSNFRMKIEGYTLSRRLYMYKRPGSMHPEAKRFIDWTLTDEAQPYIADAGFVDRALERMRLEDMGMMLIHTAAVEPDFNPLQYSNMLRELRNADRLSISFRFQPGSSILDVESVRGLKELAARMEAGQFEGQEVLLIGFADAIGDQGRNTDLALRRSLAVRDILVRDLSPAAQRKLKLVPLSYGELLPLSCNGDEVGRARNRRVEVWLRVPNTRVSLR